MVMLKDRFTLAEPHICGSTQVYRFVTPALIAVFCRNCGLTILSMDSGNSRFQELAQDLAD